MASIVSKYSDAVTANVPTDTLAPKPVVLGTVTAIQDTNTGAIPEGRSTVTLNWTLPTENEDITGETIGTSTGGADVMYTDYNPIVAASFTVYADSAELTETTDYAIVLSTGEVTLVNGQTSVDDVITIDYTATLQDLDHLEAFRIPGNLPVAADASYATVTGHGSVETVNDAIASTATSTQDVLTSGYNGEDWSYYVFAVDDETSANESVADGVLIETLVTIPQDLSKTVGDAQAILNWTAVADDNFDGANIFRCDGSSFVAANAVQANSALVATTSFDDSVGNVTNRVASGSLAYPVNGSSYTYKIEAEDTTSAWTTGTANQSSGVSEVTTASKSA